MAQQELYRWVEYSRRWKVLTFHDRCRHGASGWHHGMYFAYTAGSWQKATIAGSGELIIMIAHVSEVRKLIMNSNLGNLFGTSEIVWVGRWLYWWSILRLFEGWIGAFHSPRVKSLVFLQKQLTIILAVCQIKNSKYEHPGPGLHILTAGLRVDCRPEELICYRP